MPATGSPGRVPAPRSATRAVTRKGGTGTRWTHDLRHYAERPFATGDDLGQVVADVVLDEPRQAARDGAVCEHDFDSAEAGAHRAVPDDVDTTGVGGDHAAERR